MRGDPATGATMQEIEDVEHHVEAPRLEPGRQETGRRGIGNTAEPIVVSGGGRAAQLGHCVAHDQACKRDLRPIDPQPETMPCPPVPDDEVPTIAEPTIGEDGMRRRCIEGRGP